jgi:predicted RNA binding protein YcfA (HicA-like mRNA interferase family)
MPTAERRTIPVHGKETLGPGILLKILRDIDLTRDDLLKLL